MNFRSIHDLNRCIIRNLHRVPRDIDIVVGIPRSGMLPATLLALYLELPLAELEGFLDGRQLASGWTRSPHLSTRLSDPVGKILVIDDSANTGTMMSKVRERLSSLRPDVEVIYSAVYVSREMQGQIDLVFEECEVPRVFEWNFMHHGLLPLACVDIDGVLCVDPTEDENDDGDRYLQFVENAAPLFVPRVPVGHVVSSRLEKYRPQTEAWLHKYGIDFGTLTLMPLNSKEERIRQGNHARFKSEAMLRLGGAWFIESSLSQAREIALRTGRPVVCTETMSLMPTAASSVHGYSDATLFAEGLLARLRRATPRKIATRVIRLFS